MSDKIRDQIIDDYGCSKITHFEYTKRIEQNARREVLQEVRRRIMYVSLGKGEPYLLNKIENVLDELEQEKASDE